MTENLVPSPGEEIDLVILRRLHNGHLVTLDGTNIDLTSTDELAQHELTALMASSVHLDIAEFPAATVDALEDLNVPERFNQSGWLYDHRPIVLDEHDQFRTDDIQCTYDHTLGLRITTTEPDTDDQASQ